MEDSPIETMIPGEGNMLLGALSRELPLRQSGLLERVKLRQGEHVERAGAPIERVIFPISGLLSVVARGPNDSCIEAGLIGCDGMSGQMLVLGGTESIHDVLIQIDGDGWALPADTMRSALREDALRERLLHYIQSMIIQISHSALAYGRAVVDTRLARWLLMCQDRLGRDELGLTHEFLALMLGVRRSSVTVALHKLEGEGLIKSLRGRIVICDREGLVRRSDGFYGKPEEHYERLLGLPLRC